MGNIPVPKGMAANERDFFWLDEPERRKNELLRKWCWGHPLEKEAPVDELIADLEDVFSEVCRANWMKPREDGIWIEVIQNDRFHCDDAEEALTKIDTFTLEGEIFMRGEDDSIWRYRFADGAWREEQAYVLYEETRKDSCRVPVYVVTNGGKPVAAFADRKRAEDFCQQTKKIGAACEVTECALTI